MNRKESCAAVVQFRVRWWLKWYIKSVVLVANLTGLEPNWDRVRYWAGRAVFVREIRPTDAES